MPTDDDTEMLLRNNNFAQHQKRKFRTFLQSEDLSDVTLACSGQFLKSHRLVLAASSPFFNEMFNLCGSKDPIVVLNDVSAYHMKAILQYIYTGECQVQQQEVMNFLKVADSLLIHGLHNTDKDVNTKETPNIAAKSTRLGENRREDAPRSVATPPVRKEPVQKPIDNIVIKEEVLDNNYPEFVPEVMDEEPENIPSHGQVADEQETNIPEDVEQKPAGEMYNIPISETVEPKPELEEPEYALLTDDEDDGDFDESLLEGGEDPNSEGASSEQCTSKRKRVSRSRDNSATRDHSPESRDSSCGSPQPGPSKKRSSDTPSTSADPAPSTSQDNDKPRKRRSDETISLKCEICKKDFKNKHYLKRHCKDIHGSQTATCPLCFKVLKNERSLNNHASYNHPGMPAIPCKYEGCNVLFISSAEIRPHMNSVHMTNVGTLQCKLCGNFFTNRVSLYLHRRKVHNLQKRVKKEK